MTAYGAAVLADSPVIFIRGDDTSWDTVNGLADSSGNGRHAVNFTTDSNSGTGVSALPTLRGAGPKKGCISFGTGQLAIATSYTQAQPTVGTFECWINFAAAPSGNLSLMSWSALGTGSSGATSFVDLRSDAKVYFNVYNGSTNVLFGTSSALSTNTWHHVVASWGSAGMKIRVDKTTLGTNANTTGVNATTAALWIHGQYNGASGVSEIGAVKMAEMAWYSTQLADANTDAHYDATSDTVTLSGTWGVG